jgi:hypothetical protein
MDLHLFPRQSVHACKSCPFLESKFSDSLMRSRLRISTFFWKRHVRTRGDRALNMSGLHSKFSEFAAFEKQARRSDMQKEHMSDSR